MNNIEQNIAEHIEFIKRGNRLVAFPEFRKFSDFVAVHRKLTRSEIEERSLSTGNKRSVRYFCDSNPHNSMYVECSPAIQEFIRDEMDMIVKDPNIYIQIIRHEDGYASVYANYNIIIGSRCLGFMTLDSIPDVTGEEDSLPDNVGSKASSSGNHVGIDQDVLEVISAGRCDGNNFYFAPVQYDRKLYARVKKVLELLGGKWKGGKTQAFVFSDPTADVIDGALESGKVLDWRKMRQFFETPTELAIKLVDKAEVRVGNTVLEPSAGQGAIAEVIRARCSGAHIRCVEVDDKNVKVLESKGFTVHGRDFMEWNQLVDRVIANPPFSGHQDIRHIRKMYDSLTNNGILVSVASASVMFRQDNETVVFREWLAKVGGEIEELPEGTFKSSGTDVKTCIVKVKKSL